MKRYWRKFRQALDRAIYEGKFKQFAWLGGLLALAFCLTLGLAYITGFNPAESSADGITEEVVKAEDNPSTAMRVLELFLDPGSFVGSHNYGYWLLQLLVVLVGATFFTSFLIGAIGNLLNRRIESLTKGQYTYEFEDHVLILGSGSMLENLLAQLGNTGCDIVVQTEKDAEQVRETIMSYTDSETMKNIYVVFGKRTNESSLKDLRVTQASSIYVIGEDEEPQHDGLNLKCWHIINELCKSCTDVKNCYLVLDRLTTHNVFSYRQESASTERMRLNIVSAVENMAQGVLVSGEVRSPKKPSLKYPMLDRDGITKDSDISVHLVLVSMTQVAYAMAMTAAHICHFPNFMTKKKKTKITFIHKNIQEELDYWMGHFDSLMDLSYAERVSWDESGQKNVVRMYPKEKYINPMLSDNKGFLDVEWEFIDAGVEDRNVRRYLQECVKNDGVSEYLSLAFCGHDPEDNVAASLYLPKEVYESGKIPIFVYQPLTRWVLATAQKSPRYNNLYPFGMRTDCFDPQQERLLWAMRIQHLYEHSNDYKGMPAAEELAVAWYRKNIMYLKQQSNVYAANSVPAKLRSIGLDPQMSRPVTQDEIALLAEIEHNRWNVERLLTGYSAVTFDERKSLIIDQLAPDSNVSKEAKNRKKELRDKYFMHADIAPYGELLTSSKQYDINIVEHLPDVIKK
jgi:hypothetical protein